MSALARLLQLASPALPVGAYSYSQGLERAIDEGVVRDAPTAETWIRDVLVFVVARYEAIVLARLMRAFEADDRDGVADWNARFLASRESAELRAETVQMGFSLRRLLGALGEVPAPLERLEAPCFPAAFAGAAHAWQIPREDALLGFLWSWVENQALAAVKSLPLGQTDGQRMMLGLGAGLHAIAARALEATDEDLSNFAPGFALMSARHETQYSRLFRS